MNNIFLTNLCNNRCPYCFARGKLKYEPEDLAPEDILNVENARFVADFFQESGIISFLGGEPTLHPQFTRIADLFLEKGYKIFLFTNGKFGRDILAYLAGQPKIYHVFNLNQPSTYRAGEWEAIVENLVHLRKNVNALAVTFYRPNQEYGYIVDLARRFKIKAVKIGIAAPSCDDQNQRIPFKEKHLLAETVTGCVLALSREGVIIFGECEKLKPCMIDPASVGKIISAKWKGHPFINKQCREGGNIDIGPDLSVYRCYSFPEPVGKLTDFRSPEELRERSRQKYERYQFSFYYLDECYDCPHALSRLCDGGCLLRILNQVEERERFFIDRFYSPLLAALAGKTVLSLYDSPVFRARAGGWSGIIFPGNGGGEGGAHLLLTGALHDFDPFEIELYDLAPGAAVFPATIRVAGVFVNTNRNLKTKGWRKTVPLSEDELVSEPIPLYETDLRAISWVREKIEIVGGERGTFIIYYTAHADDGAELFSSLSPGGFIRLYPFVRDETVDLKALVKINRRSPVS